jgi:hypothetical protein
MYGRTIKSQFLEEENCWPVVGPDAYKDLPNLLQRLKKVVTLYDLSKMKPMVIFRQCDWWVTELQH